ncbi:MAG: hypothetical protein OXC48_01780, partial [Endozoicomonadaceae bacterium]|nr:hypothetical protein [Endozoicomonadaceae bacterium]
LQIIHKRNEDLLKAQISTDSADVPGKTVVTSSALTQWKTLSAIVTWYRLYCQAFLVRKN